MLRKTVEVSRDPQFDFFTDSPISPASDSLVVCPSGRTFRAPARTDLYLGLTRVDHYLEQAGLQAPLKIATLLDALDWRDFESRYAATGRAPYAPQAMMGLILYGVMQGIDTLRKLERLARQDVGCMWITGGIYPDHACLGRFITLHEHTLSDGFFESLTGKVLKVTGSGNQQLAGDGTVLEAACSHYKLLKEEAVRVHVDAARAALNRAPDDLSCQRRAALAEQVEQRFKARKQARQEKGSQTESLAVSPTEPEAMMQCQKRHRGKAMSYKASVLANKRRVIVGHGVDPSKETSVIAGLLDQSRRVTGEMPDELLLDGGYCCDVVIQATLDREISLLCPHGKKPGKARQGKGGVFPKSEFTYLAVEDVYLCPSGERLEPTPIGKKAYTIYQTAECQRCVLRVRCTRSTQGRRIRRFEGDEAKEALRGIMRHPQAQRIYSQRQAMVEPVFSVLKLRQGLTRFRRRGLAGVKREFALHVLAYNLSCAVAAILESLSRRFTAWQKSLKREASQMAYTVTVSTGRLL